MKIKAILFTLLTALLGAAGGAVHYIQLNTAIEPESGLAVRSAPISAVMLVLSAAAVIIFALIAFSLRGLRAEPGCRSVFCGNNAGIAVISVILCLAILFAAYRCFTLGVYDTPLLSKILAVFAALSGVSFVILSISGFRKTNGSESIFASCMIILFACFWLIVTYKECSADPALINYVYNCLALCSFSLAGYYTAGYPFENPKPQLSLFFSSVSAFFCISVLPSQSDLTLRIFYFSAAVYLLAADLCIFLNLRSVSAVSAGEASPEANEET